MKGERLGGVATIMVQYDARYDGIKSTSASTGNIVLFPTTTTCLSIGRSSNLT
jgi:hypothetical protein